MSHRIECHCGGQGPLEEIAAFLAAFVKSGHLAAPKAGDDEAGKWRQRFRWWWPENPACRDETPTALVLREENGGIVGFLGFIPVDYECGGLPVPSLVSTTFFVSPAHRGASIGLVGRLRALAKEFQIVDGSPSPEMVRLLGRLGYEPAGERAQYFFPVRLPGRRLLAWAMRTASLAPHLAKTEECNESRLVIDLGEIVRIPRIDDGVLRRCLSPEGLAWMLRSGSDPRHFAGLVDSEGTMLAFGIFFTKARWGVSGAFLADYADFTVDGSGLTQLIARIGREPECVDLPRSTRVLAWSVFEGAGKPPARGWSRASALYCQRPSEWARCPREFRPIEGDLALL